MEKQCTVKLVIKD